MDSQISRVAVVTGGASGLGLAICHHLAVREALGPIEILVTSAAVAGFTPFDEITLDDWKRHVAVNLTGTFLCVQAVIADMLAAKGAGSSPSRRRPVSRERFCRNTIRPPRAV